jgi:hypothetical protein
VDTSGNLLTTGSITGGPIAGTTINGTNITGAGNLAISGIGGYRYGQQGSDQPVSGTTLGNSQISIALDANARYLVSGYVAYDGAFGGGGGIKIGLTGPAGFAYNVAFNGPGTSGTAPVEYQPLNMLTAQTQSYGTYGTGASKTTLNPSGFITTSATAGNLVLQFAQNVNNATVTTIYAGSYLFLTRVA